MLPSRMPWGYDHNKAAVVFTKAGVTLEEMTPPSSDTALTPKQGSQWPRLHSAATITNT